MSYFEIRIDIDELEGNPLTVADILKSTADTLTRLNWGIDMRQELPEGEEPTAILHDTSKNAQIGVARVVREDYVPYETTVKTQYREDLQGHKITDH